MRIDIPDAVSSFVMLALTGYYAITTLQWFSYKVQRALFHHTKPAWNYIYFFVPVLLYESVHIFAGGLYSLVIAVLYSVALLFWYRGLDKRLVFTGRVKRFLVLLLLFGAVNIVLLNCCVLIVPIVLAWLFSVAMEKTLFARYKDQAAERLDSMKDMIVIGVTASYGKTSIKNFIAALLSEKYRVYATPRSVNTLAGVIKDINEDLPADTEVYIVEMGAREKGDIAEISSFVNPRYAVVGTIGPAHIEYFGSIENIRSAKLEILSGSGLEKAWIHSSANAKEDGRITVFGPEIKLLEASLEKTSFAIGEKKYSVGVLGGFNAVNIAAAVYVADEMGLDEEQIKKGLSSIRPIPHRLQRIDAGGKVILDDSFNGNIDGMLAAFDLASAYEGRKIVITPGLVEADENLNETVARRANEVFDMVIVTGDLNYSVFKRFVDPAKLLKLESKADMEKMLAEETRAGDLILFANDAPGFV